MRFVNTAIYAYYSAKMYDFEKINTGTGVPSMISSIIYGLKTVIPSEQIIKNFDFAVQSFYKQIQANNIENMKLTSLQIFY